MQENGSVSIIAFLTHKQGDVVDVFRSFSAIAETPSSAMHGDGSWSNVRKEASQYSNVEESSDVRWSTKLEQDWVSQIKGLYVRHGGVTQERDSF